MRPVVSVVSILGVAIAIASCGAEGRADAGTPKEIWRERDAAHPSPAVTVPAQASLAPLIKELKPAVVNISTTTVTKNPRRPAVRGPRSPRGQSNDPWEQFFHQYFGAPQDAPEEQRSSSLGSGFVINQDGYILTNNHVVKDATDIRVRLTDNREYVAKVVGKDPLTDVAVIRLENPPKNLATVPLGDSDKAEQGDFVVAMGSPFGYRESVSFGIVSAKDRTLSGGPYDDFIQTDAAINPGNSGGPLFNLRGEVIGINTAIVSPQIGQGIGFAVPINLAKGLLPQLLAKGTVARGYLGVSVANLTPDLAQAFGLAQETQGAVIQQVMPKTPAAKAGVQAGDLVVALNAKPVQSSGELTRGVALIPPGGKATLTVLRNGARKDVTVVVAQRPDNEEGLNRSEPSEGDEGSSEGQPQAQKEIKLGVKLAPLTPDLARELGSKATAGVVIADVESGSPAERAGLQKGDVILEVNRQAVSSPAQVGKIVGGAKPGDMVLLRVSRGPNALFIAVRLQSNS